MEELLPIILLLINRQYHYLSFYLQLAQLFDLDEQAVANVLLVLGTTHHYKLKVETWIDKYLEYDFFKLFRMTQESFNILLNKINGPDIVVRFRGGTEPTPAHTQLLMTLWWLGKVDTLISIAERFSVAESTVFFSTEKILEKLVALRYQYIVWPSKEEIPLIAEQFQLRSRGFPGIVGAIDGCNIRIKPPKHQHDSYIDRNSNYSIKLQAVSTINKVIININVGMPGSVHDIRMFRNSYLYQEVTSNRKFKYFPADFYHLVGDKAYPLLSWLMTPFKDYGNLTQRKKNYNKSLSRARIIVEHVFGWLKARWRIMKFINTNSIVKTVKIIVACCVLHNFCISRADLWENSEEEDDEVDQNEEVQEGENLQAGVVKRHQIEMLF